MDETEMRELVTQGIEIRQDDDGNKSVSGYAVKWDKPSSVLGMILKFREKFQKGAFLETLNNDDQRFLWSHDVSKVLGRTGNQTLKLNEDDTGLRFELDLPNTTLGNDTYESIQRGDVTGVSFGFKAEDDEIDEPDEDMPTRIVRKARLLEVSAVAFPAYPDSEVSARGYDRMKDYDESLKKYQEEQAARIRTLINL